MTLRRSSFLGAALSFATQVWGRWNLQVFVKGSHQIEPIKIMRRVVGRVIVPKYPKNEDPNGARVSHFDWATKICCSLQKEAWS